MNPVEHEAFGIGQRWVSRCNHFLFLVIALRQLVKSGPHRGLIRSEITKVGSELIDLEDQLRALGYQVAAPFGAESHTLWGATKSYFFALPWISPPAMSQLEELADEVAKSQQAWETYEAVVGELDESLLMKSVLLERWATLSKGVHHFLSFQHQSHVPLNHLGQSCAQLPGECFAIGRPA